MTIEFVIDPCISICVGITLIFALFVRWHMRTKLAQATIIELLADGPSYGSDLVDRSNGWLRRGSVYVHLSNLEREGLVRSWEEELDPEAYGVPSAVRVSRRVYELAENT